MMRGKGSGEELYEREGGKGEEKSYVRREMEGREGGGKGMDVRWIRISGWGKRRGREVP
jgi:hypothetical protein